MMKTLLKVAVTIFLFSASTYAQNEMLPANLSHCGTVDIEQAIDGQTLTTVDGRKIKLAGVKAPELWPEGASYQSWPHAEQSRKTLNVLAAGKTLELFCDNEKSDYTGQQVAHIKLVNGEWLQHIMVAAGDLYVFPRRNNTAGIKSLYEAERIARKDNRGLWAQNQATITTVDGDVRTGWFQIISGKVLSAKSVRKTIFLNFGENWRTDFTVEISPKVVTAFKKTAIDPLLFNGKTIEVRGWITWKGGPHIMLEGPGQIQLLE